MGQFYSREFDGDPYIDLMRSLPERELVWWAQKVIWLAEGFTFVEHFARTYPRLFQHKCRRCNGAGVLTCPACAGTKVPMAGSQQRRPALVAVGAAAESTSTSTHGAGVNRLALMAPAVGPTGLSGAADLPHAHSPGGEGGECRLCGQACDWDGESEWMDRWAEWESRLAYYDKATGPLMDEWYEDIINAGNLEEDTLPVEDEPPGPEVTGRWADDDRLIAKDKKRLAAMQKRFGHPYDADANLGYEIVDPTATMGENIWNMAQVYNSLPPELNPLRTAHLAGEAGKDGGPGPAEVVAAAVQSFDDQVAMEAAIMQNLEAAAQGLPKPHRFIPTAGTIPCTECAGTAWSYSFIPNTALLFGVERPIWTDTLARLDKYWNPTTRSDPSRTGHLLPYGEHGLRSFLAAAEGRDPLQEIAGRAPESTGRYRHELELLSAHPEVRDGRLRLPERINAVQLYLEEEAAQEAAARGRDLAAAAAPLELPDVMNGANGRRLAFSRA